MQTLHLPSPMQRQGVPSPYTLPAARGILPMVHVRSSSTVHKTMPASPISFQEPIARSFCLRRRVHSPLLLRYTCVHTGEHMCRQTMPRRSKGTHTTAPAARAAFKLTLQGAAASASFSLFSNAPAASMAFLSLSSLITAAFRLFVISLFPMRFLSNSI